MNKFLPALVAACLAVMLAMPVQAEARTKPAGINSDGIVQTSDFSSHRRYYRRYYGPRRVYWGPRRYWGPRYRYWGPRRAYWGPRYYWGPRRVWWGPRYVYWGPRYYWRPRYYWGGPAIAVGFGPRWWW
jgi:hypothetical protein